MSEENLKTRLTFTLLFGDIENDDLTFTMDSEVQFRSDDDDNAGGVLMIEEAMRTLIRSGELMNRLPELAPKMTAIIEGFIAESENDA